MKKLFLPLALIILFFIPNADAQLGIKGGINLSAVGSYGNTEDGESVNLKPGFQLGLVYYTDLPVGLGFSIELNFEQRGTISKKEYDVMLPVFNPSDGSVLGIGNYAIDQEARSVQQYINVPLLLHFGTKNLKIYAGPNIGYLIKGTAEFDRTVGITLNGDPVGSTTLELKDVDWKDYDSFKEIFISEPGESGDFLNSFEFGINVGAMFFLNDNFAINLRVSQGLTDVSNDDYDNSIYPEQDFSFPSRGDTDRNLSIQVGLAYMF
jgi:hypothetical protein